MAKLTKKEQELLFNLSFTERSNFMRKLKSEVDKANKRIMRMNDFQKKIFENKGITKITRKKDMDSKLKAYSQALLVNESEISTKRGYNKYLKKLSSELSLDIKVVDFMLNQFDVETRDFIEGSNFRYGYNPQIDFLVDDVVELETTLEIKLNAAKQYLEFKDNLTKEIQRI